MKSFGTVILLLVIVAAATLNSPATSDDAVTGPHVTFHLDRSEYLSTESASGTLTIQNTTGSKIGYSPVGGSFLIRQPDGSQREDRWITSISHLILPTWIEPGQSLTVHTGLPRCEVFSDPCTERVAIKLTLFSKTQQFAPNTTPEFAYVFVPDPNATFRVDGLGDNKPLVIDQTQTREADAVARFLNADPLDGARGLTGDNTSSDAFVGAKPIASIPESFGSVPTTSEYFGDRMSYIRPPSLSAAIAADRPQIFALVGLRKERCERFGFNCDAVAVVRAAQRARLLARALGVGVRYISLVSLYQDSVWTGHDTLVPVGIAMTMTGEGSAVWRRLPTPTPQPSGLVTFGVTMPTPISSSFMRYRRTPASDPIPITVPDDAATVVALGDIQRTFTADELRVDLKIDSVESSYSPSPNLPNPDAVAATLRAQPDVADAAGRADRVGELPAIYDMVLKTFNRSALDRLVAVIRQAYRPLRIGLHYDTSTAISNCDDAIARAYAASSRAATQQAAAAAHSSRRHLRRLVLAVAYPLTSGQECVKSEQPKAPQWIYNERLELPSDHTVRFDARVRLVFRASK